jgi:hypothetical protein
MRLDQMIRHVFPIPLIGLNLTLVGEIGRVSDRRIQGKRSAALTVCIGGPSDEESSYQ